MIHNHPPAVRRVAPHVYELTSGHRLSEDCQAQSVTIQEPDGRTRQLDQAVLQDRLHDGRGTLAIYDGRTDVLQEFYANGRVAVHHGRDDLSSVSVSQEGGKRHGLVTQWTVAQGKPEFQQHRHPVQEDGRGGFQVLTTEGAYFIPAPPLPLP